MSALAPSDLDRMTRQLDSGVPLDPIDCRDLISAVSAEQSAHLRTKGKLARVRDALGLIQSQATRAVRVDQERQLAEDLGTLTEGGR